jgi:hypothetical protein
MENPNDKMIKNDLKLHLDKTAEDIKQHDGWNVINLSELSQKELMGIAAYHGLENDAQTRDFCKFISLGTNFASMNFTDRLQNIPHLVSSLQDLILKMEKEINEYADLANSFHSIIQAFVKVVMNTKHNMKMAKPLLEESVVHMKIMADALMPDSPNPLSENDTLDVDIALTNLSSGIKSLIEHAKDSKEESNNIDFRINLLKENIESKITVCENRIGFARLLPRMGAIGGMVAGSSTAGAIVESVAFGGAGTLLLGGIQFPPLGAILLGSAIGAIGIGSLLCLIIKLWEKHQFLALGYLKQILDQLYKLEIANLGFMGYMNKSEEDSNQALTQLDFLKKNVKSSSLRYRKINAEICFKAVDSTNQMISIIDEISNIDMQQWISDRQRINNLNIFEEQNEGDNNFLTE